VEHLPSLHRNLWEHQYNQVPEKRYNPGHMYPLQAPSSSMTLKQSSQTLLCPKDKKLTSAVVGFIVPEAQGPYISILITAGQTKLFNALADCLFGRQHLDEPSDCLQVCARHHAPKKTAPGPCADPTFSPGQAKRLISGAANYAI
jgi:hypothetical protein